MKKQRINIIIPKGATTSVEQGLVELTRQLVLKTGQSGGVGLGGENGYGIDYENDVFSLHRYCWCDKSSCKWCNGNAPNFFYKPTKCEISWYKWVGRDQKQKGTLPKNWLSWCIKSLWKKGEGWYEFGEKTKLCFDATNPKTIVEIERTPMTEGAIEYWDLETILSDLNNWSMGESKEYKRAMQLAKKFPNLRDRIRKDAVKRCKEQIMWYRMRIKDMESV